MAAARHGLPREPMFVRLHGRAVHVLDDGATATYQASTIEWADPELAASLPHGPVDHDPIRHLTGTLRVRCGREISRHVGGWDASGSLVSAFDDDDLCASCWRTVPGEDQSRLFEHPQESPGAC